MIYERMFKPDQEIADLYKVKFDEYFENNVNCTTYLTTQDTVHSAGRKILNTFIEGEGLSNELLVLSDKLYGIYYFFTEFSGRCMDRNGALIELTSHDAGFSYYASKIICPDHGIEKSKLVRFNFKDDFFDIEGNTYSSGVMIKAREFSETGFQTIASYNVSDNKFRYLIKLFYAADEDSAKLQYELMKGNGPF